MSRTSLPTRRWRSAAAGVAIAAASFTMAACGEEVAEDGGIIEQEDGEDGGIIEQEDGEDGVLEEED